MAWKDIKNAPKDGTILMLGRVGCEYVELRGRWGVHRQSGVERWVDGHGFGVLDPTHFDYPPEAPKKRVNNDHLSDGA